MVPIKLQDRNNNLIIIDTNCGIKVSLVFFRSLFVWGKISFHIPYFSILNNIMEVSISFCCIVSVYHLLFLKLDSFFHHFFLKFCTLAKFGIFLSLTFHALVSAWLLNPCDLFYVMFGSMDFFSSVNPSAKHGGGEFVLCWRDLRRKVEIVISIKDI